MKKLFSAICMTLVAASMFASSTFAWFSLNTQVQATGMQITAKSDSIFLVINTGASFDSTGTATSVTTASSATQLRPVSHADTALTSSNVTTPGTWWYGYSNANGSSTLVPETKKSLTTTIEGYVASETFSVGLNNGSGVETASNLTITSVTLPANTGISVIFVCGNNVHEYKNSVASGGTDVLADTVSKSGTTVTVYYYIDGENTNVYTDNVAQLTGTVSFTLDVSVSGS